MENELYQYLKTLSNKQLLKIVEEPQDYTAEAVQVVREIIVSRNIGSEEEQAIRKELMTDVFDEYQKKQHFEEKWKPLIAFYNLVKQPSLIKEDNYLLLLLMVLLTFYYLVFLYDRLNYLYYEIRNIHRVGLFFAAINFIHLFSTPLVVSLLYRKQSSGWILSTFGKTIELTNFLCIQLSYLQQLSYLRTSTKLKVLFYIFLLAGILVCLNYKQTKRVLQVNPSVQKQTIIGGIVTGVVYFLIVRKMYS